MLILFNLPRTLKTRLLKTKIESAYSTKERSESHYPFFSLAALRAEAHRLQPQRHAGPASSHLLQCPGCGSILLTMFVLDLQLPLVHFSGS
jgi:hypothetical protein